MIVSTSAEVLRETGAALIAAAGDATRLGILRQLASDGPTCVCYLETAPGVAPNLLSYHLRILREAGLVSTRRLGRRIEYGLTPDALARLHAAIPGQGGQP
jgi:ArsR family transcriptional regulator